MAFINIGAGLSEMGKTVAQTAGAWTLQAQRDEADLEKAKVIDQLMAARESAGRKESHGYAMEQQGERLKAEAPEREARVASLRSGVSLSEDKARREREAGEGVSNIIGGGGKGGSYSSTSYGERLAGYEGGAKKGGMVDNELGSGAYGPYQFMPGTWGDVRKANPDLNLPEDMKAATKEQHKAAFDKFTATNADVLQKAGIDPTAANLYLAHRFGANGAKSLIKAEDGVMLSDVLPPEWQKQNPDMRGQTVGGFKRLAEERMKGVTVDKAEATAPGSVIGDMPPDVRAAIAAAAKSSPDKALSLLLEYQQKRETLAIGPKPPEGYRRTTEGNLIAIPGGPADPATIAQGSAAKGREVPAGYRQSADGKTLEFIPGGPADPSIMKRAAPMNNEQARDAGFADRMTNSANVLKDLDKEGTSAWGRIAEKIGGGGNYLQSKEYQQFRQAKEDFINAQLRRESGAAISKDEFDKADRQYFPQPGDKPDVITQKAKNRAITIDAMIRGAGPAYKPGEMVPGAQGTEAPKAPDTVVQQARDAILRGAPRDAVIKRLRDMGVDPSVLR